MVTMICKRRKIEPRFDTVSQSHAVRFVKDEDDFNKATGSSGEYAQRAVTTNGTVISMSNTSSPSREVLSIVADHLDIKTLAMSSCVSKTWSSCFSADHHWKQLCETSYPSISNLKTTTPQVSYHRLYSIARAATNRRLRKPIKPKLSLQNLLFTVQLKIASTNTALSVTIPGEDLVTGPHGLFQFDIDVKRHGCFRPTAVPKHNNVVVMSWNVVMKSMERMVCMMECEGQLGRSDVGSGGGWFSSKELPSPGCCSKEIGSGLMADLRLGFGVVENDIDVKKVEKVQLSLMTSTGCRNVSIDDGLRYLQHFLV